MLNELSLLIKPAGARCWTAFSPRVLRRFPSPFRAASPRLRD